MKIRNKATFTPSSLRKATRDMAGAMKKLSESAELTKEQMDSIASFFDARQELKERLNIRLQGGDPGQPFNWRGEAGLR